MMYINSKAISINDMDYTGAEEGSQFRGAN